MAIATTQTEGTRAATGSTAGAPVSVGLPVFNGERYLEGALESLLGQTFGDFELVISDNGSTDRTAAICESYAARDERVRYLRQEKNRGASWNFNKVFLETNAPFFRWASYDDLCEPTHLERCMSVLAQAPPSVVLCYTTTCFIDAEGRRILPYDEGLDLRDPSPAARLNQLVRNVVYGNVMSGLIRREALARTRLVGGFAGSDWVLLAELALLGEFWEIGEPLFLRRHHERMSTRANPTPSALTRWLDPDAAWTGDRVLWKLLEEHLAVIRGSSLPLAEKWMLYPTFLYTWFRRHRRELARELRRGSVVRRPRITASTR